MARALSPLELLLPDGVASHATVLGAACPRRLRPQCPPPAPGERSDLIIIAPARTELQAPQWLDRCVEATAAGLAADGVVYVLVPGRWRSRATRLLAGHGLVRGASFLHDPDVESTRSLVPLADAPATYAFSNVIPTRPGRRRLALLALRSPAGPRLLARVLQSVGFAARRPGGRPLLAWISRLESSLEDAGHAIITVSWKGPQGSLVVHPFADGARRPRAVAKITAAGTTSSAREHDVIRRLGGAAHRAGADVPKPLAVGRLADRDVLLQTAVDGRTASTILGESPSRLPALCGLLVDWIERWNIETTRTQPLTPGRLDAELTAPARRLAPLLAQGDEYVHWLETRCAALAGTPVPLVAVHNDLTMVNIFVDASGRLGVVDWEAGREDGLPLVDFYYAIVDATAAATRYADRVGSFGTCFGKDEGQPPVRVFEERLLRTLGLSRELADMCFHACWIQYAAHEHETAPQGFPRPFLEILRRVAAANVLG